MNLHTDDDALEAYAMGILPECDQAALEQHLLVCEACRDRLSAVDTFVRAMAAAAREIKCGRFHVRRRAAPWLAAAALLLSLLAGALWGRRPGENPEPVTVLLEATRGADYVNHAPPDRPMLLVPDLTGLASPPPDRLEIVNPQGVAAWRGSLQRYRGRLSARVARRLETKLYFVRVYAGSPEPLREYGLLVDRR